MASHKDTSLLAKELRNIHTWRPTMEIAAHWLLLLVVMASAVHLNAWWGYLAAIPLIGAVQYALLILLHDAQHSLLHPSKRTNNRLAVWCIAAPCITEFTRSQKRHLAHHQFFASPEKDPDYPLYATQPPYAKQTIAQLILHFLHRITGQKLAGTVAEEKKQGGWLPVLVMQLLIFIMFSLWTQWYLYLLFWIVPLAGVAVLLNDIRIFCEHSNADEKPQTADNILISYYSNPLERFFVAPNHMNYHAEHHLFPYVPHSQLPKLRTLIQQTPEMNAAIQWRQSYAGYMITYLRSLKA